MLAASPQTNGSHEPQLLPHHRQRLGVSPPSGQQRTGCFGTPLARSELLCAAVWSQLAALSFTMADQIKVTFLAASVVNNLSHTLIIP